MKRGLELGTAGEHLVCADLLIAGHRAFMSAAGLPYDVIAEVDGALFKVAVKATLEARPRAGRAGSKPVYYFTIMRHASARAGKPRYTEADADMVALVALDTKQVAYVPMAVCPTSIVLESAGAQRSTLFGPRASTNRTFADFPLHQALETFARG
jgi:hypothetical protein